MNEKLLTLNKNFNKAEMKKLIDWFLRNYGSIRTIKILDKLKFLGFIYATESGVSMGLEDLKIPPIKRSLVLHTEKKFYKMEKMIRNGKLNFLQKVKRLDKVWQIINEIMGEEVKENFKQSDLLNPVYMMVFSGARGNFSQVKQLVGMRGFFANSQGQVMEFPIKSNLKEGLTIAEYFTSCYGARKGIIDTALKTADAGYLTRRLVYAGQSQIIKKTNCFSKNAQLILTEKENKEKYTLTEKKLIGRVLAKDVYEIKTKKLIASKGQDICKYVSKRIIKEKKIYIRTPFNCKLNNGLCQLCYGWNLASGHIVELGENVGILAAQSIGEPGTQLTMRTFHTGGVFTSKKSRKITQQVICSPYTGIANYTFKNGKKLTTKYGEDFFFTLKNKKIMISINKINKVLIKIPKYSMLFLKPNQKVYKKQIIAEIKNKKQNKESYDSENEEVILKTEKLMTPITGLIKFEKKIRIKKAKTTKLVNELKVLLIIGNTVSYKLFLDLFHNSKTNKVMLNFNFNFKKKKKVGKKKSRNLFQIKINYKNFTKLNRFNKQYKKFKDNQREYTIIKKSSETSEIFTTDNNEKWFEVKNKNPKVTKKLGEIIFKNQNLCDNLKNKYKGKVIEIRKNKMCMISLIHFFIKTDNKIKINDNDLLRNNFEIGCEDLYQKERAEDIVQGLPKIEQLLEARKSSNAETIKNNPNEILKNEFMILAEKYKNSTAVKKSFEKVQNIIVNRIQTVYQSQQVNIADKHLEVIVKKMTSKAMILGAGDSNLMTGEIMEVNQIEKINKKLKNKIKYEPILIGISKISLSNPSFLTQASFQETTRVLARSAIEGKIDWLYGLKENLILGNLIPIGTGFKKNT